MRRVYYTKGSGIPEVLFAKQRIKHWEVPGMPKHMEDLVTKQIRISEGAQHRAQQNGLAAVKPVITISRTMGSGARIIAQKVADDLGWSLWSKELLDEMARNAQVSREIVEAFDEKAHSEVEVLVHDLLGNHDMSSFMYARHLIRAVAGIARLGNAVILGRGANFILPSALSVRIDAPFDVRVKNMMKYEQMSREDAEKKLAASDRERQRFVERTFGRETARACVYDLSLCTGAFTNEQAVELIKHAAAIIFRLPLR